MSSTSLWWRHLGNACEVKAYLIGLLAKLWRRLFLAAYTLCVKLGCFCCPAWQSVCRVTAWQTVVCCIYTVCKVERFILTIIKGRLLLSSLAEIFLKSHCCKSKIELSVWTTRVSYCSEPKIIIGRLTGADNFCRCGVSVFLLTLLDFWAFLLLRRRPFIGQLIVV